MIERTEISQEPLVNDKVVRNSMLAAAANYWYGNIIELVAGSEVLSVGKIRRILVRQGAHQGHCKQSDIHIEIQTVEGDVSFLEDTGVFERAGYRRYHLTERAQSFLPEFREASPKKPPPSAT